VKVRFFGIGLGRHAQYLGDLPAASSAFRRPRDPRPSSRSLAALGECAVVPRHMPAQSRHSVLQVSDRVRSAQRRDAECNDEIDRRDADPFHASGVRHALDDGEHDASGQSAVLTKRMLVRNVEQLQTRSAIQRVSTGAAARCSSLNPHEIGFESALRRH